LTEGIYITDARGGRRVAAADFPLSLGGDGSGIELAGISAPEPLAWLGLSDGELFLQSGRGTVRVTCNGAAVTTSQWLQHGDVIRIGETRIDVRRDGAELRLEVERESREDTTEPPEIRSSAPTASSATDETTMVAAVEFRPRETERKARPRRGLRLTAMLIWLPLIALGAVAWFVFTSRSVRLAITPAPDRFELHGALLDVELSGRYLLRPGSYRVTAEKRGYAPLDVSLEVGEDPSQTFEIVLDPLPGRLRIDGAPAGAEVIVDGKPVGVAPLDVLELAPGEHRIVVRAPRHRERVGEVTIEGRGVEQTLELSPRPLWASIRLASEPGGATVLVDGEALGTTPLTAELDVGTRRLELRLAGYKPHRLQLTVEAERARTLPVIRLEPADATVAVTSEPSGAMITVDGVYRGQTPLEIALEPGVAHRVELSKSGHESRSREVTLRSGESAQATFALEPRLGEVRVSALPSDAELLVDGESRGAAVQTLRLPAVPHRVEIRKSGFEPYAVTITPSPGFPQSIEVELKTPEQIDADRFPRRILTAQGHEMILVEGGRFTMGAPRREPGRRSNESEREVELTRRFYIATTEVSNRHFGQFDERHLSGRAAGFNLEIDHHPVVRVGWADAARYCNWLSAQDSLPPAYVESGGTLVAATPMNTGYRLPSEAEWAWVARFAGSETPRKYPWGDALPVAPESGNYADLSASALLASTLSRYNDGFPATAPVDSFPSNPLGLFNLGGNVAEWVNDFYTVFPPNPGPVEQNPLGPAAGELHVIRGSSWMDSSVSELRLTYRERGRQARPDLGYRIARYAE